MQPRNNLAGTTKSCTCKFQRVVTGLKRVNQCHRIHVILVMLCNVAADSSNPSSRWHACAAHPRSRLCLSCESCPPCCPFCCPPCCCCCCPRKATQRGTMAQCCTAVPLPRPVRCHSRNGSHHHHHSPSQWQQVCVVSVVYTCAAVTALTCQAALKSQ